MTSLGSTPLYEPDYSYRQRPTGCGRIARAAATAGCSTRSVASVFARCPYDRAGLGSPPAQPITLAAASDGSALYLAKADGSTAPSMVGRPWAPTAFDHVALAVVVAPDDSSVLAVVDEERPASTDHIGGGSSFPGPSFSGR